MKLPSTAVIAPEKVNEYLLSPRKRNDKSKWLAKAGYKRENWKRLAEDLRTQILSQDAVFIEATKHGRVYEIKGLLTGPNGKILSVRSIWMKEHESKLTKFITLFPDKK
jgi:hypothetical protein